MIDNPSDEFIKNQLDNDPFITLIVKIIMFFKKLKSSREKKNV